MDNCAFCNGELEYIDKYGTEQECLLCGTVFRIIPMGNDNESDK